MNVREQQDACEFFIQVLSFIASYYRPISADIKIKRLIPGLLAPEIRKTGPTKLVLIL